MAKIVTVPSQVLRNMALPIKTLDKRVLDVVKDMEKTLRAAKDPQGVGLAAPQIGEALRIFMIRPEKNGKVTTFVNPEITNYSQRTNKPDSKTGVYEGCLSIPFHYAPVTRSMSVTVKFQTIEDAKLVSKTENFTGFAAHVIQHEMDHLNGILFIDRVLEQNAKLFRIEGEDWTEVTL